MRVYARKSDRSCTSSTRTSATPATTTSRAGQRRGRPERQRKYEQSLETKLTDRELDSSGWWARQKKVRAPPCRPPHNWFASDAYYSDSDAQLRFLQPLDANSTPAATMPALSFSPTPTFSASVVPGPMQRSSHVCSTFFPHYFACVGARKCFRDK